MSNGFCATAQSATLNEDPVEEQEESQNHSLFRKNDLHLMSVAITTANKFYKLNINIALPMEGGASQTHLESIYDGVRKRYSCGVAHSKRNSHHVYHTLMQQKQYHQ